MNNEYYYLNELKIMMEEFLETECGDNEFGWMSENLGRRMAEAAFSVLQNNKEVTDSLQREGELK